MKKQSSAIGRHSVARNRVLAFFVLAALVALVFGGWRWYRNRDYKRLAREITGISPDSVSVHSIEELSAAAKQYELKLAEHVYLAERTGIYWKFLGMRYAERGMHALALEAFEKAKQYYPMDSALFYLSAVSAGNMAKSAINLSSPQDTRGANLEREKWLALAESAGKRAVEITPNYPQARYILAVLYAFELDRPLEALDHIERFLAARARDVDGLFVKARALFMLGRYNEALEVYEQIMASSRSPERRAEAEANHRFIREELYD